MSFRIIQSYFQHRFRRFHTRETLERYQEKRIQKLLNHVLPLSPHTRKRFQNLSPVQWREIPLMNKKEFMQYFSSLNTADISYEEALSKAKFAEQDRTFRAQIDDVTIGMSSGTSGILGLFLVRVQEQEKWVGQILARALPENLLWPVQDRIAFFLRANSAMYERTASKRIAFHYFDLLVDLEKHLPQLQALQPTLLVAPPSLLRQLAQKQKEGGVHLSPKRVISVAEPLEPIDERLFRKIFQAPVHQIYQATEGFLGSTCAYGTMHLNEDMLIFEKEWLDEKHFVPIITDLNRITQPIIRYRLDDVLRIRPTPCSCSSVHLAIDAIEGRCDDILILQTSKGERPIFADFWRRSILMSHPDIIDYGLRQCTKQKFELYIDAPHPKVWEAAKQALEKFIHDQNGDKVAIVPVDTWPTGGFRKKKRIERIAHS